MRVHFDGATQHKPFGGAQDRPLLVEIIAYAPTAYYHCTHCEVAWREMGANNRIHEEQLESSLPEDLIKEYETVSNWVKEMFRLHCDAIVLKMIDAVSIEGFYKSLKYNARHYPAVIVNRKTIPLYETEVRGTASLTRMGDALFA